MVALLSDIEVWLFVTVIPAASIATFTCSGLSSNPASSRSTRGRGIIDRVVVGDSALLLCRTRDQNADDRNGKCDRWLAHVFLRIPAVPNRSAWRDIPRSAVREEMVSNAADACVRLNGVS